MVTEIFPVFEKILPYGSVFPQYPAAGDQFTIVCFGLLKPIKPKRPELVFAALANTQVGDQFALTLPVIRQPAFEIGQTATKLPSNRWKASTR